MVSVVKSGTAINYAIEPGIGGHPTTADTITVAMSIDGVETYTNTVNFVDAVNEGVVIPAAETVIAGRRSFAILTYTFKAAGDVFIAMSANELVIESENLLFPGENSFATYQQLTLESFDMTDLNTFRDATKDEQTAALITAYYNTGSMSVAFYSNRDLSDPSSVGADELLRLTSTRKLTASQLLLLKPEVLKQLMRCQLAEADSILGGNPIERQRSLGLLSHSAGESTHFYRTTKPLELAISKRAAVELRGVINYAIRISR